MSAQKGFTIELSSRFEGWWRYNAVLMCGCFDTAGNRIGFEAAESHVAEVQVGKGLDRRPPEVAADRRIVLTTDPCDHLLLYVYLIPHTLPRDNDIAGTKPFAADLRIACDGKPLRDERLTVNQWAGLSLELRVDRTEPAKIIRL